MTVLSISGLGKSHGAAEILRGVELHIARGDKLGCVGRNGAGKTTLLRLIEGVVDARDAQGERLQPDHGTIFFSFEEISAMVSATPRLVPIDCAISYSA